MRSFLTGGRAERREPVRLTDEQRIKAFFREISHTHVSFTDPELDDLIRWGRDAAKRKKELEALRSSLSSDLDRSRARASQLRSDLDLTYRQLEEATDSLNRLQHDHQALGQAKKQSEAELRDKLEEQREMNEAVMNSLKQDNAEKMRIRAEMYENEKEATRVTHEELVTELRNSIMVNQRDSKAWTDDKLKQWLEDLRLTVQSLVPPFLVNSGGGEDFSGLDPNGFIARKGDRDFPQFVRSLVWDVLMRHFFSVPFGFGSLGLDEGKARLMESYRAWRTMFDCEQGDSDFELLFSESDVANQWRSATYESIYDAVTESSSFGVGGGPIQAIYNRNIASATREIVALTEKATGKKPLTAQKLDKVRKAVRLAAQMGLQFGVHTQRLEFTWPAHGEDVTAGREFALERGKGAKDAAGQMVKVDLVVEPGLARLAGSGGGRDRVTLLPCKLVPLS